MKKNNIAPQWGEDRVVEFVKQLRRRGVTSEHAQAAITEKGGATLDAAAAVFLRASSVDTPCALYGVLVNHDLSFAAMLRKAEFDGYVNPDITAEHFPITGEGEEQVTIELIHLNKVLTNDQVTTELSQRNMRDATLPELLALTAKFKDLQREFPIVARGSVWQDRVGHRLVPAAWGRADERRLRLRWLDLRWPACDRFACVRK